MLSLVTITPFFKWFDFWIGFYIDTEEKLIYFCPIPMCGLKIDFKVLYEEIEMAFEPYGGFRCWLLGHNMTIEHYGIAYRTQEICKRCYKFNRYDIKRGLWLKTRFDYMAIGFGMPFVIMFNKIFNRKVDNAEK